jgi:hypothetical protein
MSPSEKIDQMIAMFPDWRGDVLKILRKTINSTDSEIKEEWKWATAVWTKNGLVCATSAFKNHVKINFFKGASLQDPNKLINAGHDSKDHRAIDFYEGDKIDEEGIRELVREAIALNGK